MDNVQKKKTVQVVAWIFLLAASLLPKIILQEVFHQTVSANLSSGIAAGVILVGPVLSLLGKEIAPLRALFILFLVLTGVEWIVFTKVNQLPFYQSWLNNPSFNVFMPAEQSLRLMVTLVIIAALFVLKKTRAAFFLVKGDTSASVEPVKWLGIKGGEMCWKPLGHNFAIFISLGTLALLVLAGRPPLDIVVRALPFLPAVLLAAALNAFNEEMTYKA